MIVTVAWALLWIGLIGLLTSTIFTGMVIEGARRFHRAALLEEIRLLKSPEFIPPVTLLKPLHGEEAGLEENIRSFFEQDYILHAAIDGKELASNVSALEILFCARTATDKGLEIARRVAAEYPAITSRFIIAGEPWAPNAKICSLAAMAKAATHDLWVISDSDVRVTPDYLRRIVLPFVDSAVGCVTCLYRGVAIQGGLWSRLEAVGMTVEMSSGVCASSLVEPVCFALGPTMAVRRACVDEIGGFENMAEFCADDFVLGNRIAENGHRVVLSGHAIDHMVLHTGFLSSIKRQVRWMRSTRFSRPKGHFGTVLTFGLPFGLLVWASALLYGMPVLAWSALLGSILLRCLQTWIICRYVVREHRILNAMALFPLRDLFGLIFWVLSYAGNQILWRDELYELTNHGRMKPVT